MSDDKKMTMKVDGLNIPGVRDVKVDFPGNSYSSKAGNNQQERKFEKVVTGNVIKQKKSLGKKFRETFLQKDLEDVIPYLVGEILIPKIQDTIIDLVNDGLEMLIHGEAPAKRRSTSYGYSPIRVDYSNRFRSSQSRSIERNSRPTNRIDLDQIILSSRIDAEQVLGRMIDILNSEYQQVSVADLCDLLDVTSEYTDNKYGWTNLDRAKIRPVRGGYYLLDLPNPIPLD